MNEILRREKFLKRCVVNRKTGCWEFQGMRDKLGRYGQVKRNGKFLFAHRYSWILHRGPIGDLFVLHKCDNPICVNPKHLFLGTQKQNQEDMKRKRRHVYGEKSPNAKLKEKDVQKMYDLYEQGIGTIRMAKMFNVTKNLCWLIVTGRAWNHLYEARYGK